VTRRPPQRRTRPASSAPRIAWSWAGALLGALYVLPGAVSAAGDPRRGIALAVGVIPAAAIGVLPARRRRVLVAIVGALVGVSMLVGSALSGLPVVAVLAIFALGVGAALLAAAKPIGRVVMTLALPLVGIGLSYDDVGTGAVLALLMSLGGVYAWLISLAWPERAARAGALPSRPAPNLGYGLRLGAAGGAAAALGFALDPEHVGWACGAALLVTRPPSEMQTLRSVGRGAGMPRRSSWRRRPAGAIGTSCRRSRPSS
jgi:hypothetical protein